MRNLLDQFKTNKYFILSTAVVLVTMISCSPAQKESNPQTVQQLKQVQQTILSADTSAAISSVPATVPAAAATTAEPNAVTKTITPPELNPPHGQPYHRCDIPVGSPLNTAAPAKSAQVANSTGTTSTSENSTRLNNVQANNSTARTTTNSTAPKLNPPHGQPYHRCDIPVGSPLNAAAAPAKTAAPAKPAQVVKRTGMAPTIENAARLNNPQPNNSMVPTASNSTPPKLNPPHGQPFHRCDIAVGSPLPQN